MFKNKKFLNKKGNILDVIDAQVIILFLVMTFFVTWIVVSHWNTQIKTNAVINSSTAAINFMETYKTRWTSGWDYGIMFLAIIFPIFSFFAAKKIPISTINMVIIFLILGFLFIASMICVNIYGAFEGNAEFTTFKTELKFIPILMPNLVYYTIIYIIIVLMGLFSKPEQ